MTTPTENQTLIAFSTFVKDKRTAMGLSITALSLEVFGNKEQKSYISKLEAGKLHGITADIMDRFMTALKSKIIFTEED